MDGKQQNLSVEKIEEALELLQEAARDKKNELKNLILDKYSDLKDTFFDGGNGFAQDISETTRRAAESIQHAKQVGQEKIREAASRVDQEVHTNPWSYIGGIAVGALILGYLFGRRE
jgi:ElaB/YqjD/DUF883 family membrane-anchored ribosome-binding protein